MRQQKNQHKEQAAGELQQLGIKGNDAEGKKKDDVIKIKGV